MTTYPSSALIIDDEPDICYLLKQILGKHRIHALQAGSIAEARTCLTPDRSFDLIFLDNHLPDGLGVNFAATVKKACPHATLVMITAHDSDSDRRLAREGGVDIFIPKPFTVETIAALITSGGEKNEEKNPHFVI